MSTDTDEVLDDELQGLLADLDSELATKVVSGSPSPSQPPPPLLPEPELSGPAIEPEVADLELLPIEKPKSAEVFDLREVVSRFDNDYNEVQTNLKKDRSKIAIVIEALMIKLDEGASNTETEMLVKALEVMANTNGHAVKLLDSRSKLLAATKSSAQALIQQNFGATGNNSELQKLLAQPVDDDS